MHEARSAHRRRVVELREQLAQAEDALLGLGPGDRLPGLPLLVHAGGWRFVVSTALVADVLHDVVLDPAPDARDEIAGVFTFRGQRAAALDLARVASISRERFRAGTVVVFATPERIFGVAAESVDLSCRAPLLVPGDPGRAERTWRHTRVLAACGNDTVPILDVAALARLADFRAPAHDASSGIAASVESIERTFERRGLALGRVLRGRIEAHLRAAVAERRPEPVLPRILGGDASAISAFLESAVVSDTCFFRHPEQLAALSRRLLRGADASQRLALWSAGCGSGEEAYSLAMMVIAERPGGDDRVLATDVCERSLSHARAAEYGPWSAPLEHPLLARFCERTGSRLAVAPAVRARVSFSRHDVRAPAPQADLDAVVCRNVLSLLDPGEAASVVRVLARALRPGGYLLLGAGEAGIAAGAPLERIEDGGAVLFRRPPAGRRPRPA